MPLSRRSFLATAAGFALAACSRSGEQSTQVSATSTTTSGKYTLVSLFDGPGGEVAQGIPQRLPFAIGDRNGVLLTDDLGDASFVITLEGVPVTTPQSVAARSKGVAQPYYPFRFTPRRSSLYESTASVAGEQAGAAFLVSPTLPPARPGQLLPGVDTPTTRDHRGVEPICTRRPRCPFHTVSLADALGEQRPLALLIASPENCDSSLCPPALDLLVEAAPRFPTVRFLHAEVYSDADRIDDLADATPTDLVRTLALRFEPSLMLARPGGRLTERLDHLFDASELDEALTRLMTDR